MDPKPIFVHSLFRTGSTYIFSVFRRSELGYWCYQEPLNEHIRHAKDAPERLLEIDSNYNSQLHHPALQKPYFWELYQIRDEIASLFRKELSYDWFFIDEEHPAFPEVTAYLQCLIDAAKGGPVLQCCRSYGRAAALRRICGGTHTHLWRNPWDQWWSYKVGDYFDATTVLILNAQGLPPVLAEVKHLCGIVDFHHPDIEQEIDHALNHRLGARDGYFAFYALWLFSFLALERVADLSISIDSLSSSAAYRKKTLAALARLSISGLDFSDCKIVQTRFNERDKAFFADTENRVHDLFLRYGYTQEDLDASMKLRAQHRPASRPSMPEMVEHASRWRELAIRNGDRLAEVQRSLAEQDGRLTDTLHLGEAQREELAAAKQHVSLGESELFAARERLAALGHALAEARGHLNSRSEELAVARQHAARVDGELTQACERLQGLEHQLIEARAHSDARSEELAASRERAQRLENEWNAAKAKIDELNRYVHDWWAMADGLSHELQAVHASRSWRLTAPLRKVDFFVNKFARMAGPGISTLTSLPRRAAQRMLLFVLTHLQSRPEGKAKIARLLAGFPRLDARLRDLARAPARSDIATSVAMPTIVAAFSRQERNDGIRWAAYPPSVRRVHQQLLHARAKVDAPAARR
jgi:hypothetical protein